jgi:hypothetical protein
MSTWDTSGATTDFQFVDAGEAGNNPDEAVSRSASSASFRYAVVGAAMTDQRVTVRFGAQGATP